MLPGIAARFDERLHAEAASRYGVESRRLRRIGGFDSLVYEFDRPDGRFILRVLQDSRRGIDSMRGELDWIEHLARKGVPVARALPSVRGELLERIEDADGGAFLCAAFERAPGQDLDRSQLTGTFFRNYGELMGALHAATKDYEPGDPSWRRPAWDSPGAISAELEMPPGQEEVMAAYRELKSGLLSLPRGREDYGLIHSDAHFGNLSVTGELSIVLYDFAECCYGHFAYDIAMVIFYLAGDQERPAAFLERFMPPFLDGYRRRNRFDPAWLALFPRFMRLREIDLYAEFLAHASMGDREEGWEWRAAFLEGRKERILAGTPYLDFEWGCLAGLASP